MEFTISVNGFINSSQGKGVSFLLFNDNLFSLSQSEIVDNSQFIILYRVSKFVCLKNKFVLSANLIN